MQQKSAGTDTLRMRLRHDLAVAHERLDRALSQLDLTVRSDYGLFLTLHRRAFGGLTAPKAMAAADLAQALDALDTDIAALDLPPANSAESMEVAGLALDYVFLGSRLGTKVLRRHWQAASDPEVRGAGAYFTLAHRTDGWSALLHELTGQPAHGAEADRIVADAGRIFARFEDTYRAILAVKGRADA